MSSQPLITGLERPSLPSLAGPFLQEHDVNLFFGGGGRADIVDDVLRLLRQNVSLLRIQGERGSGKSILSLVIAERMRHRRNVLRLEHDQLNLNRLLHFLLGELCPDRIAHGIALDLPPLDRALDLRQVADLMGLLRTALYRNLPDDKPWLLVLDAGLEADRGCLEVLLELCQLRSAGRVLFQVVILEPSRAHHALADFVLEPLGVDEVEAYLSHQMMLFNYTQRDVFDRSHAVRIAERSRGVFAVINSLAAETWRARMRRQGIAVDEPLPPPLPLLLVEESDVQQSRGVDWRERLRYVLLVGAGVIAGCLVSLLAGPVGWG